MVIFAKKRIALSLDKCPKCGSDNSKIMTKHRKMCSDGYLPACVKCFDCGFTVGEPKRENSAVGMFWNPEFAIKAWNNKENVQ